MPRVPTYDNFTAAPPPAVSNVQFTGAPTAAQGAVAGQQLRELGTAAIQASTAVLPKLQEAQEQANLLRVADAKNQAKELEYNLRFSQDGGYANIYGKDALERQSGKPLADEYLEKYQEGLGKIYDGLGNDAQKRLFSGYAQESAVNFHGQVMSHQLTQYRDYAMSVHDGTIKNSMNDIALNYNNPEVVSQNVQTIKAAAYEGAKLQNKAAVFAETAAREMTSKAHLAALEAAIQKNDPMYADSYLKRYAPDMNADDILRARGVLTKQLDARIAADTASKVIDQALPKIVTSQSDRAFNILLGTESGNRQFGADGKPLTSSAGAIGAAQVMPTTAPEAAKLAGLPWDEERYKNDADYNRALGKAYFEKQLKDFGGNLPQAFAAYNGGPATTREAVELAEKNGGSWLSYMGKETQDYVQKNMKAFESGAGAFNKPTLAELKNQVREQIGVESPERLKIALEETERRYSEVEKAVKQRDEEAVSRAFQAVMQNGGRFTDLPPEVRMAVPPEQVGKVIDFAAKWGKGEDVQTDWSLYYDLKKNPSALANVNLLALRNKLNDTEFKELVRAQDDLRQKGPDANTRLRTHKEVLNQFMDESLGYHDVTPKEAETDSGKEKSAIIGRIWKAFEARIAERRSALGRELSYEEMKREAAQLFTTVNKRGFFSDTPTPVAAIGAEDEVVIPDIDRKHITAALTQFKKPVTEENIRMYYLRQKAGMM